MQRREHLKAFFQILQPIISDLVNTIYVIKGSDWIFRNPKSSREMCSKETSSWRTCFRWSSPEPVIFLHRLRLRLRCFKEESAWSPIFKWSSPASVILSHLLKKYKREFYLLDYEGKWREICCKEVSFWSPWLKKFIPSSVISVERRLMDICCQEPNASNPWLKCINPTSVFKHLLKFFKDNVWTWLIYCLRLREIVFNDVSP